MNIIFFTHPEFTHSLSISKYANMLALGMRKRNHRVEIWTAKAFFNKIPNSAFFKKWLGYIDRFIIFPLIVKRRLMQCSEETLFVFTDQALGPWIPLVANRPHVIHCHDFLALRVALDEFPENKLAISGKVYQKLIRKGYQKGDNFISISQKTQTDLHRFLNFNPQISEVVYNGLNQDFKTGNTDLARIKLTKLLKLDLKEGYILHIGGNQFYKNRIGVLRIYMHWRTITNKETPLLMIGSNPTPEMEKLLGSSEFSRDIHFISNISDKVLQVIYQGATALLFPSLDEGFGWPIAEAMASGCPVITTDKAPMNEVGGRSCFYLPPYENEQVAEEWAGKCAFVLDEMVRLSAEAREKLVLSGIANSNRFNTENSLWKIESIYSKVMQEYYS